MYLSRELIAHSTCELFLLEPWCTAIGCSTSCQWRHWWQQQQTQARPLNAESPAKPVVHLIAGGQGGGGVRPAALQAAAAGGAASAGLWQPLAERVPLRQSSHRHRRALFCYLHPWHVRLEVTCGLTMLQQQAAGCMRGSLTCSPGGSGCTGKQGSPPRGKPYQCTRSLEEDSVAALLQAVCWLNTPDRRHGEQRQGGECAHKAPSSGLDQQSQGWRRCSRPTSTPVRTALPAAPAVLAAASRYLCSSTLLHGGPARWPAVSRECVAMG